MKRIEKIEELLGVKMGEKFKIYYASNNEEIGAEIYMVDKDGLNGHGNNCDWYISLSNRLVKLMTGEYYAKKIPLFPEDGTEYHRVSTSGDVHCDYFNKGVGLDVLYYKIGNFYNTREEAEKNKEKWIKFFNDPKTLDKF